MLIPSHFRAIATSRIAIFAFIGISLAGCGGGSGDGAAGGSCSSVSGAAAPLPLYPSSYENAKKISLSPHPSLPSPDLAGIAQPTWFHGGFAYADFFQEGRYSAVVQMAQFTAGANGGPPDLPAKIYFLRKNASGNWCDATSAILSDQSGCISPRKTLIADFNGDGKPDVFNACHGYDGTPDPSKGLVWGEYQRILLSQPNGSYKNVQLPFFVYGHGASAADLDGDGKTDIVLTNPSSGTNTNPAASTDYQPLVLIGHGDGTFHADLTRLPASWQFKAMYAFELIDVNGNGKPDLFAGVYEANATGNPDPADPTRIGNLWAKNNGAGKFTSVTTLPNNADSSGMFFNLGQDFAVQGGHLYMSQTSETYNDIAVQKIRLSDLNQAFVYSHHGTYSDGGTWFPWIYPTQQGTFETVDANALGMADPRWTSSRFSVSFPQ